MGSGMIGLERLPGHLGHCPERIARDYSHSNSANAAVTFRPW